RRRNSRKALPLKACPERLACQPADGRRVGCGFTTLASTRDLRPLPTPHSRPVGRGGILVRLELRLVERPQPRLEGLLVEELLGGFLAGFPAAEVVERFLRA